MKLYIGVPDGLASGALALAPGLAGLAGALLLPLRLMLYIVLQFNLIFHCVLH